MNGNLFLTKRYMKRHFRQQLGAVLVLTLFASAILTMSFLTQCFHATNEQAAYNEYGSFGGQTIFANTDKVNSDRAKLGAEGNGIVSVQAQVQTSDAADAVYIGYMDENARKLRAVRVQEGRFPTDAHEIALDKDAYYRLNLNAKVGEKVTLKLKNKQSVQTETYTLTGILYDYADHWRKIVQDNLVQRPNAPTTDPELPSVLTGSVSENTIAMHVFYKEELERTEYGDIFLYNMESFRAKDYTQQLDRSTANVTLFIGGFFLLLTIFGTWVLAHVTLQSREKFTKTLQKVGLTGRELRTQFLTQAGLLTVIAWVFSLPLSFGILALILAIAKGWGTTLLFSVSWWMPLVSLGLMLTVSVLIFLLQAHGLQKSKKRSKKRKQKRVSAAQTFSQLWTKLYRKSSYGRMTALTVLCLGCVLILEFGTFSGETAAATHFYGAVQGMGTLDYQVYVEQGACYPQLMGANFPRDLGMSEQKLEELRKSPDLDVQCAYIDNTVMPAFIRVQKGHSTSLLDKLMKQHTFESDNNQSNDPEYAKENKQAKLNFGYTEQDVLITNPSIVAVDRATMKKLLQAGHRTFTEAELDTFVQGKNVFSLGKKKKKGDTFTVSVPIIPEGSTTEKLNGKGSHKDFAVTVQDSFTLPQNVFGSSAAFHYGTKNNPCIVMSAESALSADSQLRYFQVCANRAHPNDAASSARASDLIHRISASSKGMGITDREESIAGWKQKASQEKWPIYALTIALVAITLAAVTALNRIKIKSNLHTYALLCAVGTEPGRLQRNLIKDSLKSIGVGCAFGFCAATVPCMLLIQHYWYVPLLNIWLSAVLPLTLLCIAVILCVTAVSSAATVHKILKNSILASLSAQY